MRLRKVPTKIFEGDLKYYIDGISMYIFYREIASRIKMLVPTSTSFS